LKVEELNDLIEEYERDDRQRDDDAIYMHELEWRELKDEFEHNTRVGNWPTYHGYDIIIDPLVRNPKILPKDIDNLRGDELIQSDPPEHLLKQLFSIEETVYTDPLRDTVNMSIQQRVFLKPFCKWVRFSSEMVEKYGQPGTTHNLRVINGPAYETTKTEFDNSEAVKFGQRFATTRGGMAIENPERTFCQRIRKTIEQVNTQPLTVERTRTFTMPYPVLDIEHTERHHFGQQHTTYEGVTMVPYDRVKTQSANLASSHGTATER